MLKTPNMKNQSPDWLLSSNDEREAIYIWTY